MNLKIRPLPTFERDVKLLKKKYPNIWKDLAKLKTILMADPLAGKAVEGLEGKIFKLRLASSDIKKGKRGGYRVIYYFKDNEENIYLLSIYVKAYKENISVSEIKSILAKYGL
ncbi:MAG: type II toxin-antitoxin system RelE/ParE family toxin [Nitrospirota bacterium]|nr:type II toxin-antitoxin system RelE/ParE family toxin [Nitrospirota bacterium]